MNSMRIVIPTHERAHKQITLNALPAKIRNDVLLVVSTSQDLQILKKLYPNNEVVRAKADGIAKKRHWIMKNVDAESIFMLDDDMYFFGRTPVENRQYVNGRWKPKPAYQKTGGKMLAVGYADDKTLVKLFKQFEKHLRMLAHVGLSSRMGNDCVEESWKINTRMMHAFGLRTDVYKDCKLNFGEVRFREDFNITLHLLKRGYQNTVAHDFCVGPGSYNSPGGASGERTVEESDKEADKLAMIHPGLVSVVQRNYGGEASVPRKEVICYWKKAFESGSHL